MIVCSCSFHFYSYFALLGMILTDKRGNLTPSLFEDLMLLHMNDWYHGDKILATANRTTENINAK